ncbi:MAG: glycosyltransferase, partial [Ignavibacterium sp.]|nr:glycosyltransferase [Ignavibacterium sp.]
MKLSIIIINWNTKELIKKCLNSVLKYTSFTDYQLIVIDNNSSDGSQKFLSDFCLQNKLNLK